LAWPEFQSAEEEAASEKALIRIFPPFDSKMNLLHLDYRQGLHGCSALSIFFGENLQSQADSRLTMKADMRSPLQRSELRQID
jgi:hypothetical protein